jgi:hypothetical protein
MKVRMHLPPVAVAGIVLAALLLTTSFVVIRIGALYQWGLLGFSKDQSTDSITLRQKKQIRKITVRRGDAPGCMEVTPDGAVRIYSTCGEELTNAQRPSNPKNILRLFQLVSERDLPLTLENNAGGVVYELTIETDQGTEIAYLIVNDETPPPIEDIIGTIDDIEEDLPEPTATPAGVTPTSTTVPSPTSGGPTPTGTIFPTQNPTPTPSGAAVDLGFICDYYETTGQKPYNISNFVCSTGPTPFPQ